MSLCSYEAYAAARGIAAAELLENGTVRWGRAGRAGAACRGERPHLFVVLAVRDVERRIPPRSKAHICRSCRRCANEDAAPREARDRVAASGGLRA
jgi:hypothetical protein